MIKQYGCLSLPCNELIRNANIYYLLLSQLLSLQIQCVQYDENPLGFQSSNDQF